MWKSFAYLFLDVGIVAGLAIAAFTINQWWVSVDEPAALNMARGMHVQVRMVLPTDHSACCHSIAVPLAASFVLPTQSSLLQVGLALVLVRSGHHVLGALCGRPRLVNVTHRHSPQYSAAQANTLE